MMEREELKSYLNQLIKIQSIGEVKPCWLPLLENCPSALCYRSGPGVSSLAMHLPLFPDLVLNL